MSMYYITASCILNGDDLPLRVRADLARFSNVIFEETEGGVHLLKNRYDGVLHHFLSYTNLVDYLYNVLDNNCLASDFDKFYKLHGNLTSSGVCVILSRCARGLTPDLNKLNLRSFLNNW